MATIDAAAMADSGAKQGKVTGIIIPPPEIRYFNIKKCLKHHINVFVELL
jgi:hypothetical protein